jgi:hypothetical protein
MLTLQIFPQNCVSLMAMAMGKTNDYCFKNIFLSISLSTDTQF